MDDSIEPMPKIDQQQLAERLVEQAGAEGSNPVRVVEMPVFVCGCAVGRV